MQNFSVPLLRHAFFAAKSPVPKHRALLIQSMGCGTETSLVCFRTRMMQE